MIEVDEEHLFSFLFLNWYEFNMTFGFLKEWKDKRCCYINDLYTIKFRFGRNNPQPFLSKLNLVMFDRKAEVDIFAVLLLGHM